MPVQERGGSQTGMSVVLLYHRIGPPKLASLVAGQYVAPRLFRHQLDYLTARGWVCKSLGEIGEAGEKAFAVTFDDGYLSVYEHAVPILRQRGMTATLFVVADTIGGINVWDHKAGDLKEKMMSAEQIRELVASGFEIGSHTLTHPHLTELDDDQLARELRESKSKIEEITGSEVVSFSYPYGDCDARVLAAAAEAGYKYGVTTRLGVLGASGQLEIPRVNVRWNAIGPLLMRKISRARAASAREG